TLRRYVHLSTGNYHVRTSHVYTDFGLLTCNDAFGADVNEVFLQLTGLGRATTLKHLWQAPFTLHTEMLDKIREETAIARKGRRARIVAKMNALLEPGIIDALYAASQAGVEVDLIVRGVCALRPGIPGVSDNIRVRSIIGRFLEHTRVFYFHGDGAEHVYLSSADWMERNFFRRIEVCFPILDPDAKRRVIGEGLWPYVEDTLRAWEMDRDGNYRRFGGNDAPQGAQESLIERLAEAAAIA
ncbi:MAG: RNA degradosome polyphosphate kinase, partial [Rhodospirillaceae bacterium]